MKNKISIIILAFTLTGIMALVTAGSAITSASRSVSSLRSVSATQGASDKPQVPAVSVGSGFTYQGSLKNGGSPANGQYDFQFTLYDALAGGNLVGGTITTANVTVTVGLFAVTLDFGQPAFTGDARYLEIAVRPTGVGGYITLTPRRPLTPAPYALSLKPGAVISGTTETILSAINTSTTGIGYGIQGESHGNYAGVRGTSTSGRGVDGISSSNVGVFGISTSNYGMFGISGSNVGVYGLSSYNFGVVGDSTNSFGVLGSSANSEGVHGQTGSISPGVYGHNTSIGGIGPGVRGDGDSGPGVYGLSANSNGVDGNSTTGVGVAGHSVSGKGVWGVSTTNDGVYGSSNSFSGVAGISNTGNGVYGFSTSSWAGYFAGNVRITGSCCFMGAGTTQIDHPQDPANKYLNQSAVVSPNMLDILDGNVTTDAGGTATVQLPSYFEALNTDFRYQLTVVGQFSQAIISSKVKNNSFRIKTDKPNVEVSWQVTGIRHDPYAMAHPIQPEQDKPSGEKGKYLHPVELGQPESLGIGYAQSQRAKQLPPPTPGR